LVRGRLLSIDPHYEYSGGAKEVHKPIERRLKSAERAPPPIDERNVVLAGREAARSDRVIDAPLVETAFLSFGSDIHETASDFEAREVLEADGM
jgi:hypothetical protein